MKPRKGLALYDLQFPVHNKKLLPLVDKYMATQKWDYVVYGGDIMDMDAINHYALGRGDIRQLENKRLKKDYEAMATILRKHRKIVGPDCQMYMLMGNHEEWAEKLVDKFPGLEGLVEVENNLPLKELQIKVIPPRGYLRLGKLHFIHGDISGGYSPVYHAKKVVEIYNRNVVYGHHHTLQVATRLSPIGIDETHTAYALPCLADTNPHWAGGKPNKWLNGFGVFYITKGEFSVLPVVAAKNSFISPEGQLFN